MNVIEVLRLPLAVDLSGFVALLRRLQVPHRVVEEGEEQVLWAPPAMAHEVLELYRRFPEGNADLEAMPEPVDAGMPTAPAAPSLKEQARACKVTAAVLLLSLVVAGVTGLGDNLSTIGWFTFLSFKVQGDYLYFTPCSRASPKASGGGWFRRCCCTSAYCTWP